MYFNGKCSILEYDPKEIVISGKGRLITYTVTVEHKLTKELEVVFYTENTCDIKLNNDIREYWKSIYDLFKDKNIRCKLFSYRFPQIQ